MILATLFVVSVWLARFSGPLLLTLAGSALLVEKQLRCDSPSRPVSAASNYFGVTLWPVRFQRIDRWESVQGYRMFRTKHAAVCAGLDKQRERLTTDETSLGHYQEVTV